MGLDIANNYNAEIISADSRQFYKELEIGTAKPNAVELDQAKHHFINSLSINDDYDVGQFEMEAISLISQLHQRNRIVLMVGGSGLYVNAIINGIDKFPEVKEGVRSQLNEEHLEFGLTPLVDELKKLDPEYAQSADLKNPQRVIRALEVIRSSGKKFSSFRNQSKVVRPFEVIKVGLEMGRETLYNRIDKRIDLMIDAGLFDEAKKFLNQKELNALQTVGYREIFPYLEGKYDYEEAVRLLKRNSRRYAKRQLTWFKKDSKVEWFEPHETSRIINYIDESLKRFKAEY